MFGLEYDWMMLQSHSNTIVHSICVLLKWKSFCMHTPDKNPFFLQIADPHPFPQGLQKTCIQKTSQTVKIHRPNKKPPICEVVGSTVTTPCYNIFLVFRVIHTTSMFTSTPHLHYIFTFTTITKTGKQIYTNTFLPFSPSSFTWYITTYSSPDLHRFTWEFLQ